MSDILYPQCADALSACQATKDDLAAILHPETGFAPRLLQIAANRLADLESSSGDRSREADLLRMECDTWALLQTLMPLRKTARPSYPSAHSLLAANPYTPPRTLAQSIMNTTPFLAELVAVREWLHDTAPDPVPLAPGPTTGYWRFTRHALAQSKRLGKGGGGAIVGELDPDAVNREGEGESEGRLAVDDANYEKALLHALFAYVRAGRLDEAVDVCRRAHQPWRAASIRGGILFDWRALSELRDEDRMEDDEAEDSTWRGNFRRRLWKTTCMRAALNPSLPPIERALYAALAPSPQTRMPLNAVCRAWADQLWALISVACEERLSAGLAGLDEGFWVGDVGFGEAQRGGSSAGESGVAPANTGVRRKTEEEEQSEVESWENEARSALDAMQRITTDEGNASDNPYFVSQIHIILGAIDQVFDAFALGLRSGSYKPGTPEYPLYTRFFAHLGLYLKMIDVAVPPLAMQIILEAYLQVLEGAGQRDLIAMYAGALGDNAIERYAMFLTSLELSADIQERRLALTRAREHGLDVHRVAVATAERTIERAFATLPQPKGPLPNVAVMQPPASDAEKLLVRSIEWTTFVESTFETALEQANVILRYSLSCGRVQVAKALLDMLPPELGTIREPEERATEYYHYRQFFLVWDALERVADMRAMEAEPMSREVREAWLNDYGMVLDQAREELTKMLTTEWLLSDVERSGGDRRRRELVRIRQIFIPQFIIRLHILLVTSHNYFPENLKHALLLANIVADSRYKLYEDFANEPGRRLGDYLSAVRVAVLGHLEGGGSDPFSLFKSQAF